MPFDPTVQESYAKALIAAAGPAGRVQAVFESARDLAAYLETHPDRRLRTFIESPQVPEREKHQLIRRLFEGRVDKLLVDLMCLMVDKHRSDHIAPALRRFCELADLKKDIYPGVVSTAKELSSDEKQRMQLRLERFTGHHLRLRFRVESRLIGGVVFKYRDLLVDSSLRAALDELRGRLFGVRLRLAPPVMESR